MFSMVEWLLKYKYIVNDETKIFIKSNKVNKIYNKIKLLVRFQIAKILYTSAYFKPIDIFAIRWCLNIKLKALQFR